MRIKGVAVHVPHLSRGPVMSVKVFLAARGIVHLRIPSAGSVFCRGHVTKWMPEFARYMVEG